jgi:biopolymer transport protein ExbD
MRRRVRDEEHVGELNIVPYLDIVTNLVMFMLLSMTGLLTLGVVNVSAPKIGGDAAQAQAAAPADGPRLLLTVAISKKGFYVAGAGGVLGADAPSVDAARPPTVPLRSDGKYDFEALTAQMQRVKERYPKETNVIFSADGDVSYETLIQAMDAVREARVKGADGSMERRPLFFDVSLSVMG